MAWTGKSAKLPNDSLVDIIGPAAPFEIFGK